MLWGWGLGCSAGAQGLWHRSHDGESGKPQRGESRGIAKNAENGQKWQESVGRGEKQTHTKALLTRASLHPEAKTESSSPDVHHPSVQGDGDQWPLSLPLPRSLWISSNYGRTVTTLFKVPEVCVILFKASGAIQVTNTCLNNVALQSIWGWNSLLKANWKFYTGKEQRLVLIKLSLVVSAKTWSEAVSTNLKQFLLCLFVEMLSWNSTST